MLHKQRTAVERFWGRYDLIQMSLSVVPLMGLKLD
jgi:hypothetical protein